MHAASGDTATKTITEVAFCRHASRVATSSPKKVNGDDLLYFFLSQLIADSSGKYAELPQLLLEQMGIWLPLDVYARLPVMLPWVVRDNSCRGNKKKGLPDQWSSPNEFGYSRDDNSLIKGIPRSLDIASPKHGRMSRRRMGSAFVASHVWRETLGTERASRQPLLNSFVPNVVWLPRQISKLTDREGSIVQQTLQAMSWQVYRHAPVAHHLEPPVAEAWALLPPPTLSIDVDPARLNWFEPTNRFYKLRQARIREVIDGLDRLADGMPLEKKVGNSRYTSGLPDVAEERREALRAHLARFVDPA